jgi:hypothetical protein
MGEPRRLFRMASHQASSPTQENGGWHARSPTRVSMSRAKTCLRRYAAKACHPSFHQWQTISSSLRAISIDRVALECNARSAAAWNSQKIALVYRIPSTNEYGTRIRRSQMWLWDPCDWLVIMRGIDAFALSSICVRSSNNMTYVCSSILAAGDLMEEASTKH